MTLRVGIIGAGAVAHLHAGAIADDSSSTLAAVCDLDRVRAVRVARAAGSPGAAVHTDHLAMLEECQLDAVIVNTPHALHAPMIRDALARNCHVLAEKPLSIDAGSASDVVTEADDRGLVLGVGQIQHFLPEKMVGHQALMAGRIGEVLTIDDRRTTDYRPGHRSAWFFDRKVSGGGAIMNIGGHCIDRAVWLGGARVTTVNARLQHRWGSPVETDGQLDLALANGIRVAVSVRSDQPHRTDEVIILGSEGTLRIVAKEGTWLHNDGRTTQLHTATPADIPRAFDDQWHDFRAGIDGAPLAVDPRHGQHVVEVITAAYTSATVEQPVEVAPLSETVGR